MDLCRCFRQSFRPSPTLMDPAVFPHDTCDPALSGFVPLLFQRDLHPGHTIVVIVRRFIQYRLYCCRKNSILPGFSEIPSESVITGFTDVQDFTQRMDRPSGFEFFDKTEPYVGFYFFRLDAKKPSASWRISFARFVSRSSFSSSRIR